VLAVPERARACGGTFCQTPTQPVVQSSEDIVYVKNADGTLTMSVRIVYQGSADGFAWIIPLPAAPAEIEVGTDSLFQGLGQTTPTQFLMAATERDGTCRAYPQCVSPMPGGGGGMCTGYGPGAREEPPSGGGGADAATIQSLDAATPPVEVIERAPVGPYESVILRGGSATELQAWLTDNGYFIPPTAVALMEDYVAAGQVFVALRLLTTSTVASVRPIVLRLGEVDPCLPIRLTSIATVQGLPITTYFLADRPAVPTNYSLLDVPEDARLWMGGASWGSSYAEAIDAAGGQAFVFDSAAAPPTLGLALPPVDDLRDLPFTEIVRELLRRNYWLEPALPDLLARFVVVADEDEATYVRRCLASFGCSAEPMRVEVDGLLAALEREIRAPRVEADAWLAEHTVLTRLYTSMSAEDMTVDPEFRFDEGVPLVSPNRVATLHELCSEQWYRDFAPTELELPSGRRVPVTPGVAFADDAAFCESYGWRPPGSDDGCSASFGASRSATRGLVAASLVLFAIASRRRRRRLVPIGGRARVSADPRSH
jgi:hypothetical protein